MKMPPVLCCIVFLFVSMLSAVARQQEKPRVIVTTDGEIDDQSSMIRFLMYSSDYDVAGIVQVNGVQKDGHSKDKWIESQIAKYAECLPNLRKHNPDYPDAEYLLSVLAVGNENREDLHKLPPLLSDSEGAQLIIRTLLDSDPWSQHPGQCLMADQAEIFCCRMGKSGIKSQIILYLVSGRRWKMDRTESS